MSALAAINHDPDIKAYFEEVIPEDVNEFIDNLNTYRKTIKVDFEEKVKVLNDITKNLIEKKTSKN